MQLPIFVSDPNDLMVFTSVDCAERYIEPWGLKKLTAYDGEGRLLHLTPRDPIISISLAESEPGHREKLTQLMRNFLEAVGESSQWLAQASFEELTARSLKYGITQ